jgi:hypothetical protein
MSAKFLDPRQIEFAQHPGGLLDVTLEGEVIEGVHCVALFPLSDPRRFISIVKPNPPNPEEIGIIVELAELADEQRRLVEAHIAFRYFVPEIEEIVSIQQLAGLYELRVVTERGPRTLFILNPRESVSVTDPGVVVITDVEQCRYKITHLDALSPKSRGELERVLL